MQVSQFVPAVYLKATGQIFDGEAGDEDWQKILAIGNRYIDAWVAEPGVEWESTYTLTDIGTISTTDLYDLDESIFRVSNDAGDPIVIRNTDGSESKFYLVASSQLGRYTSGNYVSRFGNQLKFNRVFSSSDVEFGGTIQVPGYVKPDYLVNENDEIPVDDPNWLVLISAAEWTRTDNTLLQSYPLLIAEANNAMTAMKQANRPAMQDIVKWPVAVGNRW